MDQKICVVTATREKTIEDFKTNLIDKSKYPKYHKAK
jgi:hypothetical protein